MAQLPEYTLAYADKKDRWILAKDGTARTIISFATKKFALRGGVLGRAIGREGGTVKIQMQDGRFQEQRIYPPKMKAERLQR